MTNRKRGNERASVEDDLGTWCCEAVSADFSDAYMHWRVDPRERQHCYTVHFEEGWLIQWLFLCLRLKGGACCNLGKSFSEVGARIAAGS